MPNSLQHETSPYLLQHANNPVNWYAWNEESLELAREQNKLILVSIGYSACHWCHVMEHECFEDEQVARIMNDHFINIKVDREERPDVDQVYMNAVQLMTGRGGWPLNCFTLPDGRPVYGGTYFPKQQWINVLLNLADVYKTEPEKVLEYAEKLTEGIRLTELVENKEPGAAFRMEELHNCYEDWEPRLDHREGGPNKAPKFPLPNNYLFLLRYALAAKNEKLLAHVHLTLRCMAYGGIYDQLGGGFARYSTDTEWKVPHFEKMLYDNAQLVSLYAEAYRISADALYRQVIEETLAFVERELTSPEGVFYSALDADSEGEEGKYYVWNKAELEEIAGDDFPLFADCYNVNEKGYWEHGNYILLRRKGFSEIAKDHGIELAELETRLAEVKQKLLAVRDKRIRPGLDDKSLTSWNALMAKGYTDAYLALGNEEYLEKGRANLEFILTRLKTKEGGLYHSYKNGRATINGFLEDYAFVIEACLAMHQVTLEEKWLDAAGNLLEYVHQHFNGPPSGMFFFTSDSDSPLIARKTELSDNVIPASCSSLANSLFVAGKLLQRTNYIDRASQMLNNVRDQLQHYGPGYSNWALLLLNFARPFYEVAVIGERAMEMAKELQQQGFTNAVIIASVGPSGQPLLKDRFVPGKTLIYVCENNTCQLPVESVQEAFRMIRHS